MTTDKTTRYTCEIEIDIFDDADIQKIELQIERALDGIDPFFETIDWVRAGNLYKHNA